MYVALKNTEHKGVYKKENFKNEWRVKGASIRSFKVEELEEALNWAGVKALSIPDSSDRKNKNNTKSKEILSPMVEKQNPIVNIINKLKKRGVDGVCISTRNLGDIILKLNPVYYLCVDDKSDCFDEVGRWDIAEKLEEVLESNNSYWCKPENYSYHILKVPHASQVKAINEVFVELRDIWTKNTSNSIEWEVYNIDNLLEFEYKYVGNYYYGGDAPELYDFTDEYYLNINDIIGIKEIGFGDTGESYLIPNNESFNYSVTLSRNEYKKVVQILDDYEIENVYEYTYDEC